MIVLGCVANIGLCGAVIDGLRGAGIGLGGSGIRIGGAVHRAAIDGWSI